MARPTWHDKVWNTANRRKRLSLARHGAERGAAAGVANVGHSPGWGRSVDPHGVEVTGAARTHEGLPRGALPL